MGMDTKISWCDASWNPWIGCTKVSQGCRACYAESLMDHRYGKVQWGPEGTRVRTSDVNWRKPLTWNRKAGKEGRRYKVFCASLADVFEDRPELVEWRVELFRLIVHTPALDWLLLTKRPQHVMGLMNEMGWPSLMDNVWLGTSVENQEQADKRIPELLKVPARIRFLSCEPLLGPVDLRTGGYLTGGWTGAALPGIGWVIAGAESGHGARPMDLDWVRSLRDQCQGAGTPFFFKQAILIGKKTELPLLDGRRWAQFPAVNGGAISLDDLPRNGWATLDRQGNIEEYDGEWDGDAEE